MGREGENSTGFPMLACPDEKWPRGFTGNMEAMRREARRGAWGQLCTPTSVVEEAAVSCLAILSLAFWPLMRAHLNSVSSFIADEANLG